MSFFDQFHENLSLNILISDSCNSSVSDKIYSYPISVQINIIH